MFGSAALFLLTPALTVSVVVAPPPPGPDDACPSSRQVGEAMLARFPDALLSDPAAATTRPDALRSILDVAGDGTVIRFSLVDARGETQLRRALPAPGRARPSSEGRPNGECLALADTLAVIVERYLGGIASDAADAVGPDIVPVASAPPAAGGPAAAGRTALLLVGLGWRTPRAAGDGPGEPEARVGGQLQLTRSAPRLSAALSLGISRPIDTPDRDSPNRMVTFWRFPVRLGAVMGLPLGPGTLEPMIEATGDVVLVSSTAGRVAPASHETAVGLALQGGAGYRVKVAGRLFVRPLVSLGAAIRQYDIRVEGTPEPLLRTPWWYASFGIDAGVLFQ